MRIPSGVTDQYIYFVAVDSTDFTTRETGLTSFTVYRSRNGSAPVAMTTPTVTEVNTLASPNGGMDGVYALLLDEDMTIGAGNDSEEMVFHITQASMAPVTRTIELYRPKITAGYTLGTGSDGDLLEVNTLTGHTAQTGDNYARLGAPAGASIAADIATVDTVVDGIQTDLDNGTDGLGAIKADTAAILTDTAEIGAAGAGLTAIPWNASWDAEVQSEVNDGLVAFWTSPATLVDLVWDEPTAGHVTAGTTGVALTDILADTNELQTDDVPGLIAALNDPTAAAIADAVLDEALSGHTTAGTLGKAVADIEADATAILADTADMQPKLGTPAADISADIAAVKSDTGAILTDTSTTIPAQITGLNDPTAAAIADAVWDEAIAGHAGVGSTGEALSNATAPTAAQVADAVWEEAIADHSGTAGSTAEALNAAGSAGDPWTTSLPGSYTGTQAGKILSDVLTDTAEIGTAGAGLTAVPWNAAWDAEVQSECTDALNAYDPPTKAELDSGFAALNDPTAAAIADAVLDEALAGHVTAGTLGKAVADIETDATAILADTNELQTDWANGGRLDLLIDAIKVVTDALPDSGALTSLATAANLATVDTNVDAILVDTGTTIPALIAALNDLAASDILTTQLTESYPTDGTAPTLSQAIFLIQQFLYERSTSGTTVTVKQLDGSTTAATLTLDDATTPTSITRTG